MKIRAPTILSTAATRRLFFFLFAALLLAALPTASQAQWGKESLGGIFLEAPSCVSWGINRLDCFARGTGRDMFHDSWDGASWSRESLGGIFLEAPSCVSWGVNRIDCFARGTAQDMWHEWWDGASWSRESLGGIFLEAPSCVSWGVNRIDCFARGTAQDMWHEWWNGSRWDSESLGGIFLEAPSCVSWGINRVDCFARGTAQDMWHEWWDGSHWDRASLGGVSLEAPSCVSWGINRIDCLARGADRAMWHQWLPCPDCVRPSAVNALAYQRTNGSAYSLSVTFKDNSTDETGFTIGLKGPDGIWRDASSIGAVPGMSNFTTALPDTVLPLTSYCLQVSAHFQVASSTSAPSCYITPPLPPLDPVLNSVTPQGRTAAVINFTDQSTGESGFNLSRHDAAVPNTTPIVQVPPYAGTGAASFTDSGLTPGHSYLYRMFALGPDPVHGGTVMSLGSNFFAVAMPALQPPAAPSALHIISRPPFSIVLGWTDNSNNEQGFTLQDLSGALSATNHWVNLHNGIAPDATSIVTAAPPPVPQVCYRVVAWNGDGASPPSNEVCPLPPIPAAPSLLRIISSTPSSWVLGWVDNSNNEDGFWMQKGSGSQYTSVASVPANTTSSTVSALPPGSSDCYRVVAFIGANNSPPSSIACAPTVLLLPNLIVSNISTTDPDDYGQRRDNLTAGLPFAVAWYECDYGSAVATAHTSALQDGEYHVPVQVGQLNPGECVTLGVKLLQGRPEGNYTYWASTDTDNSVREANEQDNDSVHLTIYVSP